MRKIIGQSNGIVRNSKGGCYLAGTLVKMGDNTTKPIENVVVGDVVGAYDILGLPDASINDSWVNWGDDNIGGSTITTATVMTAEMYPGITEYYLINGSLKVTNDHHILRFSFTTGLWEFKQPANLVVGDMFRKYNGGGMSITSIDLVVVDPIDTYTFDVETVDTYFVECGSDYIVTHNVEAIVK